MGWTVIGTSGVTLPWASVREKSLEDLAVSRYLAPLATTWLRRHGCCLGLAALS